MLRSGFNIIAGSGLYQLCIKSVSTLTHVRPWWFGLGSDSRGGAGVDGRRNITSIHRNINQVFDTQAPISRKAHKKRKAHQLSQISKADQERDLADVPTHKLKNTCQFYLNFQWYDFWDSGGKKAAPFCYLPKNGELI